MEDKQMKQYPFFSKIGAFSINLEDAKSSIKSLRYAVESMKRKNSCLFIYPEGKLTSVSNSLPEFKEGLSWLYKKLDGIDFVPIAFYIDYSKADKPDLFISIGKSVKPDKSLNKKELSKSFEEISFNLLNTITSNIE